MTIKSKFDTPELTQLLIESGFTQDTLGVWRKSDRDNKEDYEIFISDMPAVTDYVMIRTTPWNTKKFIGTSQSFYDMETVIEQIMELGE
jgi:hypothetical protein